MYPVHHIIIYIHKYLIICNFQVKLYNNSNNEHIIDVNDMHIFTKKNMWQL